MRVTPVILSLIIVFNIVNLYTIHKYRWEVHYNTKHQIITIASRIIKFGFPCVLFHKEVLVLHLITFHTSVWFQK